MDATMCWAFLKLHEYLKATDKHLILSGITEELWATLYRSGLVETLDKDNLF